MTLPEWIAVAAAIGGPLAAALVKAASLIKEAALAIVASQDKTTNAVHTMSLHLTELRTRVDTFFIISPNAQGTAPPPQHRGPPLPPLSRDVRSEDDSDKTPPSRGMRSGRQ